MLEACVSSEKQVTKFRSAEFKQKCLVLEWEVLEAFVSSEKQVTKFRSAEFKHKCFIQILSY